MKIRASKRGTALLIELNFIGTHSALSQQKQLSQRCITK